MKGGSVSVWLSGEVQCWLRRMKEKSNVSVSGFIRDCVLRRLKDEKDVDSGLQRFLLLTELAGLFEESQVLRKTQNVILANFVYLRDYAREVVKGGYKNPAYIKLRRSILSYPGAEKAVAALERVFGRREQIGERMCEIIALLYPEQRYEELDVFREEYQTDHVARSRSLRNDNRDKGGESKHG